MVEITRPSIVVKPNTGSGSQKLVGIGNFDSGVDPTHNLHVR